MLSSCRLPCNEIWRRNSPVNWFMISHLKFVNVPKEKSFITLNCRSLNASPRQVSLCRASWTWPPCVRVKEALTSSFHHQHDKTLTICFFLGGSIYTRNNILYPPGMGLREKKWQGDSSVCVGRHWRRNFHRINFHKLPEEKGWKEENLLHALICRHAIMSASAPPVLSVLRQWG